MDSSASLVVLWTLLVIGVAAAAAAAASSIMVKDACGGGELTSYEGEIMSPNYPGGYGKTEVCYWTINHDGDPDSVIRITIRDLDLSGPSSTYGELWIRDGPDGSSPMLEDYYYGNGADTPTPFTLVTSGPAAFIGFYSYHDITNHRGFNLHYTTEKLCPTPYLNVGGLCLHFVFNELTYDQSGIACREESGELAAINNPQDLRDLYRFLQNNDIADTSFWIGGSNGEEEGLWKWKDNMLIPIGTPFWGTTDYYSEIQEPNGNEDENCLMLSSNGFHFFRDANCTTKAPAICMH